MVLLAPHEEAVVWDTAKHERRSNLRDGAWVREIASALAGLAMTRGGEEAALKLVKIRLPS